MTISLSKGQTISLAKNGGLSKVMMGLGWDAAKAPAKSGGFFSRVLGGGGESGGAIDLDASVLVFDDRGGLSEVISFRKLTGMNGAIVHSGDNRTGDGDGDDESITVDLPRLPADVTSLVFTVNNFTGQDFSAVENATCRLVNANGGSEMCRFVLSDKGAHTGVVMAVLSRASGEWTMKAVGEAMQGRTAEDMTGAAKRHI